MSRWTEARGVLAVILCVASPLVTAATDVALVGLFPGKAVIVIEGGAPRTVSAGQVIGPVKILAVERDAIQIEEGGRRSRITLGAAVSTGGSGGSGESVSIPADISGHFITGGSINGASVTFMVDTGASTVAMGPAVAASAGIDFRAGQPTMVGTANGVVQAWSVRLDRVTVGSVTLQNVEGMVVQTNMPVVLLGMSFLNRMEMRREGSMMTLRRRF